MKKILLFFIVPALLAAVSSCSKDPVKPPLHITVEEYEVNFDKNAGSHDVTFCYIGDWCESSDNADWCDTKVFVTIEDGHMVRLNVAVDENTSGQDRECEVTVSTIREGKKPGTVADRIDRVIKIRQSAQ